jgi:hypothetical protein
MLVALFRARIRALLLAVLLGFAAPRVARLLRGFGERRQRAGGRPLSYRVPLGAADALDKAAVLLKPERKRRGFRRREQR